MAHGKRKILEAKVMARRSITDSTLGEEDMPLHQKRHPEVAEKLEQHGEDTVRAWLKVQDDLTDVQIADILREVREDQAETRHPRRSPRYTPAPRPSSNGPGSGYRSPITPSGSVRYGPSSTWAARDVPSNRSILTPTTGLTSGYGPRAEKRLARAEDGPFPGSGVQFRSRDVTEGSDHGLAIDPARILMRDMMLNPSAGADIFHGDRSKFLGWWHRINQEMDELGLPAPDRIRALRARTSGKPRDLVDLISYCQRPGQSQKALQAITDKLFKRFGNSADIAEDVRSAISKLTPIKASDKPEKLQELADQVTRWSFIMENISELRDLDTATGLFPIRTTLPIDLQRRWTVVGDQYRNSHDGFHPPLSYFRDWLDKQATLAADPHFKISFGLRNEKDKGKKDQQKKDSAQTSRTLRTEGSGGAQGSQEGRKVTDQVGSGSYAAKKEDGGKKEGGKATAGPAQEAKTCMMHGSIGHSSEECTQLKKLPKDKRKALGLKD